MIGAIHGALGALGQEAKIGGIGGIGGLGSTAGVTTTAPAGGSSFGAALSHAIGSLDATQQTATTDAQGLATGTISDPTTAITAVENASLAMDMAAQIQNKLVTATNTIFQTQV